MREPKSKHPSEYYLVGMETGAAAWALESIVGREILTAEELTRIAETAAWLQEVQARVVEQHARLSNPKGGS